MNRGREERGKVALQGSAGVLAHSPVTRRKQHERERKGRRRSNHDGVNYTDAPSLLLRETGLHRSILSKRMGFQSLDRGWSFFVFFFKGPVQFSSVAQSCPTLCDPMNRSTPGLPVHHQLPEFTQTHVYRVRDAIQPSHPLSSPSPPAPNPSQHQSLFQ